MSSIVDNLPYNVVLDEIQLSVVSYLENIALSLETKSIFDFFKSKQKNGVYLYGGVGRGKTMIMQAFYDRANLRKKIIHYQDFMQYIHLNIHKLNKSDKSTIIAAVVKDFIGDIEILCLDEFEIKDIVDAMIIDKIFKELNLRKVFVFITSNTKPEDLYSDGLQRNSFLRFINYVTNEFHNYLLDNKKDYRLDKVATAGNRILYPIDSNVNTTIIKIITDLTHNQLSMRTIKLFGRELVFAKTYDKILVTDFNELFTRDLSYIDYVNICKTYKIIILEKVDIIDDNNTNIAIRFINFIDSAYFQKNILFVTLFVAPENIYNQGIKAQEFRRAVSRLFEMNSDSYLEQANAYK